jgi:ABC-type nitrate/sulfonate/bicarbonate transport system substrate-binding protein
MSYSRKNISNAGDRVVLEQAEAREIYRTWQTNRDNDFVRAKLERCEKIYGSGARDRVRTYMSRMKEGQIE